MWAFLADEAAPFLAAAARAYGRQVLAGESEACAPATAEAAGRGILRLVFGARSDEALPAPLVGLAASPDSEAALAAVADQVGAMLAGDDSKAEAVVEVIAGFYRRRAGEGDAAALVGLGGLFFWDRPEAARAAFQQAVDAGHPPAMLALARFLLNVSGQAGDHDAAAGLWRQAIGSADPACAAEAMVELAGFQAIKGDGPAARATYQRAIDTGHPDWAPAALVGLAGLLARAGEADAAEDLYRRAIGARHPDWSGHAACGLGTLLKDQGDAAGAKSVWQQVIEAADPEWAGPAFTELVNLLRVEDDIAGLRAACELGAATANPDALYALDVLGQELARHGDTEGAHAAWRQAIAAGYEHAEDLLERMSPPAHAEPADEGVPAGLPPAFDPKNAARTGADVLDHGLPALPETLNRHLAIPVAYWKSGGCAVVLVLVYSRTGRADPHPMAMELTYSRVDGRWVADPYSVGGSFSHDPLANPGRQPDLDGCHLTISGGSWSQAAAPGRPAVILTGSASPAVACLAVARNGREERRPLDSHFGAWVICAEEPGPVDVIAYDAHGAELGRLREEPPPGGW